MTVKPLAARAFSVFALLMALAAEPASSAAADRPTSRVDPAAQQKAAPPPGAEQKGQAPQAPKSIPIPEIVKEADDLGKLLRDLGALSEPLPAIDAIEVRLPLVNARLDPEFESTVETLKEAPPGTIVDRLAQSWRANHQELAEDVEALTRRATQLEEAMDKLVVLRVRWTQTRAEAQASRAPAAVIQRVDAVLADIEATRTRLQARRAATLVLQDRVAHEVARCEEALALVDQYRQGTWALIFVRSTPSIWSFEARQGSLAELPARAREAAVASLAQLRQFIGHNTVRLLIQGVVFIGLIGMALGAQRRGRALAAEREEALPASALFERPFSSAAVAALALTIWMFTGRPRVVTDTLGILILFPVLRIVRRLVAPALAPALYTLAALCLFDRIRANVAVVPLADQLLLLLDMLVAVVGLVWLIRSGRLGRTAAGESITPQVPPARLATAVFSLAVCAAAFAAAAYGTLELARKLGATFLLSAFAAIITFGALHVADGLLSFALRIWPLKRLGMVARHRSLLERRGKYLLRWILALTWMGSTLRFIGVWDQTLALGQAALAAELRRGAIAISLGDVVAFLLTVWLAFLVSALLRFILAEELFPHLRLGRGLPYVISSLLHYVILFVGFLLAMAALGVDLNKVTVLAGAFGVGLGFGLQGMVNNFVSGLVVLLERPINVGDAIQMGDLAGEVRQIGIRSTTVRTWDGADVIVPNASLVSEKVTNWTHSDLMRRMDVAVGVAYGSAPRKVLDLLLAVARAHPGVLAEPAPVAIFLGFGDSALNFELRAWTRRFSQWIAIRSELGVAVYEALGVAGIEIPFPQREVRLRESGGAAGGPARGEP